MTRPRSRRHTARLIRRVIEGGEEREEVVDGERAIRSIEGLLTYLRGDHIVDADVSLTADHDQLLDIGEVEHHRIVTPDRCNFDIPINRGYAVTFIWGDERFTVIFPIKGEGKVEHDLPIGRVEWIIETRKEEEELEDVDVEDLEDLEVCEE